MNEKRFLIDCIVRMLNGVSLRKVKIAYEFVLHFTGNATCSKEKESRQETEKVVSA